MEQTDKCAHEYCHCSAQADTGYCSDYCQQNSLRVESGSNCGCGHADCATTVTKTQPAG